MAELTGTDTRPPHGRRRATLVVASLLALLALLLAALLTGFGRGSAPVPTLDLNNLLSNGMLTSANATVTLPVGRTLRIDAAPGGGATWHITSGDLTHLLHQGATTTLDSCPSSPPKAGCMDPEQYTFTASATGSTTLVWLLGPSVAFCESQPPPASPALDCATVAIHVVVH